MFRRSFTTTTRLLRQVNDKPPARRSNIPLRPGSDHAPKSHNIPKKEDADKPELGIIGTIQALYNPRSEHFILAAANAKLSEKQRTDSLRLLTIAVTIAWATDTWLQPWNEKKFSTSREEDMVNLIAYNFIKKT
ncbi:hypothetical protein BDU57DRAFT_543578 [Ampelomyces quisqualis]|uniref:Uncharacterized protein n=1 Tax=Ampelomyces quisqualis TaxID=50730 RepID=A0A6A5QA85_AMPQU|nr:hypothetical protein BDU57DRAFT_543578 [Ampelomyces quisqualis]